VSLLRANLADGVVGEYESFADECLAEYDLDGWSVPDLDSFPELRQARQTLLGK
jgi:4-hydroxyphenylacetate 3-monooxygenase